MPKIQLKPNEEEKELPQIKRNRIDNDMWREIDKIEQLSQVKDNFSISEE